MQKEFNQRQPINAQNVPAVVDQYIELAGELTKVSAVLRAACCTAESTLANRPETVAALPHAIKQMQQVLAQLDYLSEACHHFAIDLLCGTDYPWPEVPPLFASISEFKSTRELKDMLETQIQRLCASLAAAETWFNSPLVLTWTAADLSRVGSAFLDFISPDT